MSITIKRISSKKSFLKHTIAIRLNKTYVAEIANNESIALEIPAENSLLSYNIFDYPRIRVSNEELILLKQNKVTLTLRIFYLCFYLLYLLLFQKILPLTSPISNIINLGLIPIIFLPTYRFEKQTRKNS
ncbi:hypothetical protein [Streptococcus pseudoporcinus]|uniref:Membrane protein n=1 Tax=Streptococcus pseudoporcinus TaxID=361101 RepID=A0A4U9XIT6_9STRE|nr:hypothetical protein [Streptococcus pseudoporcinus]VTS13113.1 membrane protein [Streptococcus pseudoporcinus]VUC66306.1 membrane protein [Streptococcus pseudoporcinus]VUC97234.1 membrane protein [Streptococcus pseudoporcinus]VUC97622.1 membrane protein [Streptococcus pseudoporcinus]